MKRIILITLLAVGVLSTTAGPAFAGAKEDKVKTAFLYNFTKFIQWPESGDTFTVGVVGDDAFASVVSGVIDGKPAAGGAIAVKTYPAGAGVDELKQCRIVYFGDSEAGRVGDVVEPLAAANVLTVGHVDGFAGKGGMVGFLVSDKVTFELNKKVIDDTQLKVSAKLFQLAKRLIQ